MQTFPVPVVVTVSCYVAISVKTYRVHNQVASVKSSSNNDKVVRMTIMVFCLVLAHLVLTLPAFLVNLISAFDKHVIEDHFEGYASDLVLLMFFVNTAVNPLLYGIFNTNFQKAARKHCICVRDSVPPPTVFSMLRRNRSAPSHITRGSSSNSPGLNTVSASTSDIIIFNPLSTFTKSFSNNKSFNAC